MDYKGSIMLLTDILRFWRMAKALRAHLGLVRYENQGYVVLAKLFVARLAGQNKGRVQEFVYLSVQAPRNLNKTKDFLIMAEVLTQFLEDSPTVS